MENEMSERKSKLILFALAAFFSLVAFGALGSLSLASLNTIDAYGVNAMQVQVGDTTRN